MPALAHAIDAKDWATLASPLVAPILARAQTDPEGLITDLAGLYPELNATALEQGLTERQFTQALEPRLRAKGWWGQQTITGPQGVPEQVRLGKISNAERRADSPVPILQDNRDLRMSILPDWDRTRAVVGTNLVYAPTHQFGADQGAFGTTSRGGPILWGDIPARPFLGLAPADFPKVEGILSDFIRREWRESA